MSEQLAAALAAQPWLPAALGHAFMLRALAAVTLLAPLLGLLGPLVVARRMAFFTSTLGHAALAGIALGVLLGRSPDQAGPVALGVCLVAAALLTWVRRHGRLAPDTAVGVLLSATLGVGVCLLSLATRRFDVHQIEGALFGNLVTVTEADLALLAAVVLLTLPLLLAGYDRLVLGSLDPALAPGAARDYLLAAALAGVVVACLKVTGFLLVESLVVVPAAAARGWARSLRGWVVLSAALALLASWAGLALSYAFPVPPGAAVAVVLAATFGLSLATGRR